MEWTFSAYKKSNNFFLKDERIRIHSSDLWIRIHGVQICISGVFWSGLCYFKHEISPLSVVFKEREKIFFLKDGTFETSPPPFADGQIVFIHAKLPNGRAMPAAFSLLSRKVFVIM